MQTSREKQIELKVQTCLYVNLLGSKLNVFLVAALSLKEQFEQDKKRVAEYKAKREFNG